MPRNLQSTKETFYGHNCICSAKTAFESFGEHDEKPVVFRFCCSCERRFALDATTGKPLNEIPPLKEDEIKNYVLVYSKSKGYYAIWGKKENRVAVYDGDKTNTMKHVDKSNNEKNYFKQLSLQYWDESYKWEQVTN